MRVSQLLLPTVKEDPAGAEAVSHKLMVRAGLVRQLAAGIYVFLPAGWRVMQKIEQIIREEMDAIGCQEMLMPVMQPAEIWQESGRWDAIGEEMFRLKDRKRAEMVLAMTHEEVVTWLAAREVHSYKQLPQLWYHFQTKERDEARPKSGILRTREFIMKDSYSLDVSEEALQESYRLHIGAYDRIYRRCGLEFMMVEGDSGMMGGAISHEYMAFAEAGEDEIVFCRECAYASNVETAVAGADPEPPASELTPRGADDAPFAKASGALVDLFAEAELDTPDCKTIQQVADYLGLPARAFVKALVVVPEGGGEAGAGGPAASSGPVTSSGPVMVLVRGDHELNELKLERALGAGFRMATPDEVLEAQGVEPGFVGPVPTPLPVYADESLRRGHYVAGANRPGFHRSGVTLEQVPQATFADLRDARPGDPCAQCPGELEGARVIEVGNIFQLGLKYSVPMGATFLDEDGKEKPIVMGSYGIGLARIAAAAVEQHHDDNGIVWPASIAPFHVHLILVRASDDTQRALAEELYASLGAEGFEVVFDDREMSPGIKFKDADLLGCPAQVVVGKRAGEGVVELKERGSGERRDVPVAELAAALTDLLARA
ncbi:MAG: proline--tRNA ligase [Actinobacteria bacterium]|nr:proline--tRNA ligase [Actinomycetota bacterium]